MKVQLPSLAALAIGFASLSAAAGQFDYTGSLPFDNSVAQIHFTLAGPAANVQLWTDSYQDGVNFDPAIQLWSFSTGALLGASDDYAAPFVVKTGQTAYDSGFGLSALGQGTYVLTIIVSPNFAVGSTLAEGFIQDGSPSTGLTTGTLYSAHISFDGGVIPTPVPEPQSYALMLSGLAALGWAVRRRA